MEVVVLIGLCIFGLVTTVTDYRWKKIKNVHVVLGLLLLGILSAVDAYNTNTFQMFLLNAAITILFLGFLWIKQTIPAADVKLLLVYCVATPIAIYPSFAPQLFPSVTLIFTALLLASLFVFLRSLHKVSFSVTREQVIRTWFIVQIVFIIIKSLPLAPMLTLILIYFAIYIVSKKFPSPSSRLALLLTGAAFYIARKDPLQYAMFALAFTVIGILFEVVIAPVFEGNILRVKRSQITEGMVLAEPVIQKNKKAVKPKHLKECEGKVMIGMVPEGLQKDETTLLKKTRYKWFKIQQEIPFAPFAFAALLLILYVV